MEVKIQILIAMFIREPVSNSSTIVIDVSKSAII